MPPLPQPKREFPLVRYQSAIGLSNDKGLGLLFVKYLVLVLAVCDHQQMQYLGLLKYKHHS